ncbi:HAMP domain-containing sensor histidine kinase [Sporosarcina cyprini]|uniref:HAMP domain-containing sensor histidine kinase n=1 Tax=Sporosarcina cyprini TaxID=2910523 RepID=UPI001EE09344|nr:HAMP domain-containing sensor histidine kinase [Sporosarcina cyprini]MCG3089762.1 HAMP domain-containing histidine kinase [Sporosarcina cyprini]
MAVKTVPIRTRLHRMIAVILLLSFVCTIMTWGGLLLISEKNMNYANHYENMIPAIKERVKQSKGDWLDGSGKEMLDSLLPKEGISYKVVDHAGVYQYGNFGDHADIPERDILENINTVEHGPGKYFVNYIPLFDKRDAMQGVLLLYYTLQVTPVHESQTGLVRIWSFSFAAAPFVYILLFTLLFVSRLSRQLKIPLSQLMEATARIRDKDLQFHFNQEEKITEIRELTNAFEQMRDELAESLQREWNTQKERKNAIAALAHDIRTPLTVIQGHVEGLEEAHRKGIDRFEQYLPVIKSNISSAVKLVHDLNQTAILDSDSFSLNKISFDPEEFFTEKMGEYELLCARQGVQFNSAIHDNRTESGTIHADPYRLTQVFDNLLSNSLRFAKNGAISFSVQLEDERFEVTWIDNGPGFSDGQEAKIFESFYQGNRRKGHAGLGLYIAKSIIDKHGGLIKAGNAVDGGAVISISLPTGLTSR